jgi:hypothetical protein
MEKRGGVLMPNFDSGVKSYVKGRCVIEVGFPVDWKDKADVSCNQCPYYTRAYKTCQLNKEFIHYGDTHIGAHCPLEFTGEMEE